MIRRIQSHFCIFRSIFFLIYLLYARGFVHQYAIIAQPQRSRFPACCCEKISPSCRRATTRAKTPKRPMEWPTPKRCSKQCSCPHPPRLCAHPPCPSCLSQRSSRNRPSLWQCSRRHYLPCSSRLWPGSRRRSLQCSSTLWPGSRRLLSNVLGGFGQVRGGFKTFLYVFRIVELHDYLQCCL